MAEGGNSSFIVPKIDYTSDDLGAQWTSFEDQCDWIFSSMWAEKPEAVKVGYLIMWLGETGLKVIKSSELTETQKGKLKHVKKVLSDYFKPHSHPRVARMSLHEMKQG